MSNGARLASMLGQLRALSTGRLGRGAAATTYGHLLQTIVQLISIPLLSRAWGLEEYGCWMILFTVPQLLAMGDIGLITAGGNEMTAAVARGDRDQAARIYAALRWAAPLLSALVAALLAAAFLGLTAEQVSALQALAGGKGLQTAILLFCYGVLGMSNLVTLAAFRATDAFASSIFLFETVILFEAICALGVAAVGYGPMEVAAAYLGCRAAGSIVLVAALGRHARWLRVGWAVDLAPLRVLIAPSIAAAMLPIAYAVILQGSVLAIGAAAGPAAVPMFTAARTLSRSGLQFAFAFNRASMPRYTVAVATDNEGLRQSLMLINLLVTIAVLLPVAALLLLFGQPFVSWWTGGVVVPSAALVALLVGIMLVNGAWMPISNFILATNRQAAYSYVFLATMVVTVAAGYALARRCGAEGMTLAWLAGEVVMVGWIARTALRTKVVDFAGLRRAVRAMADLKLG